MDYFNRLHLMNNERWPKLLFNATYHIFQSNNNIKWKWFNHTQNCLTRCGLDHIFSNAPSNSPRWVNDYREINKNLDLEDWLTKAQTKSLEIYMYLTLKDNIKQEKYLLENENFTGVSLKLRARTNTLQLERYIRSWSCVK